MIVFSLTAILQVFDNDNDNEKGIIVFSQIKSNQNTFVKRRMSQANQRRIVAETRQSVHIHHDYRQCQTAQFSKYRSLYA